MPLAALELRVSRKPWLGRSMHLSGLPLLLLAFGACGAEHATAPPVTEFVSEPALRLGAVRNAVLLVNGVRYETEAEQARVLAPLSPADIESIEVTKVCSFAKNAERGIIVITLKAPTRGGR